MGATGFEEAVETSKKSNGLQKVNAGSDAGGAAKHSPSEQGDLGEVPEDLRMILGTLVAMTPEALKALGVLIRVIGQASDKQQPDT